MKKRVSVFVCMLATATVTFGQGFVNWTGLIPTFITAQTNSTEYSPLFFGGGASGFGAQGATSADGTGGPLYYFALLYQVSGSVQAAPPTTLSALNTWQDTGLSAINSVATAGRITPVNANPGAIVPWSSGVTNSVMLVGWSANLGTTWSAVSSALNDWPIAFLSLVGPAFFGTSNTGFIAPSGLSPGNNIFGVGPTGNGNPINSPNMQLYVMAIPEPGTLALVCLGGLTLLTFRRNK